MLAKKDTGLRKGAWVEGRVEEEALWRIEG